MCLSRMDRDLSQTMMAMFVVEATASAFDTSLIANRRLRVRDSLRVILPSLDAPPNAIYRRSRLASRSHKDTIKVSVSPFP
jgi:hypothetical protein